MERREWKEEEMIKEADESISYYRQCVGNGDSSMWLGLYMSQQWRKLLDNVDPDLEQLKLFAKALGDNGNFHGSQWHFMSLVVRQWVEKIEEEGKTT